MHILDWWFYYLIKNVGQIVWTFLNCNRWKKYPENCSVRLWLPSGSRIKWKIIINKMKIKLSIKFSFSSISIFVIFFLNEKKKLDIILDMYLCFIPADFGLWITFFSSLVIVVFFSGITLRSSQFQCVALNI